MHIVRRLEKYLLAQSTPALTAQANQIAIEECQRQLPKWQAELAARKKKS